MGGSTSGYDYRFCLEHVKIAGPNIETNGTGRPGTIPLVHQQVGHHNPVVDLGGSFPCRLGNNRLVAFTVDHDLPFSLTLETAGLRILHYGKAPFLKFVYR